MQCRKERERDRSEMPLSGEQKAACLCKEVDTTPTCITNVKGVLTPCDQCWTFQHAYRFYWDDTRLSVTSTGPFHMLVLTGITPDSHASAC